MVLADLIRDLTEHLKVYLLSGTLVAVGVDVARGIGGSMTMVDSMSAGTPLTLTVQAVGGLIALVGTALYVGNIWCGFVVLRQFRFRFDERGPLLKLCGWSAAFVYVLSSAVIGVAVNAVYLALVG